MPAAKPRAAGRAAKTAAASPAGGGGRAAATRSPAPARGAQDEASDLIDALLSKKALGGSPRANGRAEAHEGAAELAALENSPLPVKVADAGATKLTPLKRKTAGADSPGGKSQLPPDAAAKKRGRSALHLDDVPFKLNAAPAQTKMTEGDSGHGEDASLTNADLVVSLLAAGPQGTEEKEERMDEDEDEDEEDAERRRADLKGGFIKGQWTREEDDKVIAYVQKFGTKQWARIAQVLPGRKGKQCRERWHNHLNPDINKEAWSAAEDALLIEAHSKHGNRWAEIAKALPGRTDNAIKNRWNSTIRRKILKKELPQAVLSAVAASSMGLHAESHLCMSPLNRSSAVELLVSASQRGSPHAGTPGAEEASTMLMDCGLAAGMRTVRGAEEGVRGAGNSGRKPADSLLQALQMDDGGMRRAGAGVFRAGASKLRVDVEMPHEDQEALDALRLLSSGYGANNDSPVYHDAESLAEDEDPAGKQVADAGESSDEGRGARSGKNKDVRDKSAGGHGRVEHASSSSITPVNPSSKGEGKITPHKAEAGCADGDAWADGHGRLDSETAAAIRKWGLAMSLLPSLTPNDTTTTGMLPTSAKGKIPTSDRPTDSQYPGLAPDAIPSPSLLSLLGIGVPAQDMPVGSSGLNGWEGLHALNALKLVHLASLFNMSAMPGLAHAAAPRDSAAAGSESGSDGDSTPGSDRTSACASGTAASPTCEQEEETVADRSAASALVGCAGA